MQHGLNVDSPLSRKERILVQARLQAAEDPVWRRKNRYFHKEQERYAAFLIPPGRRVLELGCGVGHLLAALKPSVGVGVDFCPEVVAAARSAYPDLTFLHGDVEDPAVIASLQTQPFDFIVMSDTIGALDDVQATIERLHLLCGPETRLVIIYHSRLWQPVFQLAEKLKLKGGSGLQNWLSPADIANICTLADFEEIKREWRILLPKRMFGIGPFVNKFLATLPLVRKLSIRNYVILRSRQAQRTSRPSVSIIVPCRNERGNIRAAVTRTPIMAPDQEIIFVEGHSSDGTFDEVQKVIAEFPHLNLRGTRQEGKGKGDAVRKGFAMARGDVLMILDADLTMPPEELPKYYALIASNKAEFVNGSRLVYPMEGEAMRFLNLIANHLFANLFSFMLNQRFTDTLCGTKVVYRAHYENIAANRTYFGDFDPFGDFDLIFGATKLNLKIAEIPIRYAARTYGTTQISRFRHGLLLARMVAFAWWKMKAI